LKSPLSKMLGVQTLGTGVTILDRYALIPVFVISWGLERYGVWALLKVVPAYLAMLDLGFGTALGNKLVYLNSINNKNEGAGLYRVVSYLLMSISFLILLLLVMVGFVFDLNGLFGIDGLGDFELYIALLFMVSYSLMIVQTQLMYAAYRGDDKYLEWNYCIQAIRVVELLTLAFTVFVSKNLAVAAGSILVVRVVGAVIMRFVIGRNLSVYKIKAFAKLSDIVPLIKPSIGFLLFPIGQAVNIQAFLLIVGSKFGPESVAVFNILRTYSRLVMQAGNVISKSIMPEFSKLFSENKFVETELLLSKTWFWSIAVVAGLSVGVVVFSEVFIEVWTSGKVEYERNVLLVLIASSSLCAIWYAMNGVLAAVNVSISIALAYISISVVAGLFFLIYGQQLLFGAIALLVTDLIMLCLVFLKVRAVRVNVKK